MQRLLNEQDLNNINQALASIAPPQFTSVAAALAAIPVANRIVGKTIQIVDNSKNVTDYWFYGGTANANFVVKSNKIAQAFTMAFAYPVRILQDYYESSTTINSIILKDAGTLEYSTDGNIYTTVSLPLTSSLVINGGSWIYWRITYATNKTLCSVYFKIQ